MLHSRRGATARLLAAVSLALTLGARVLPAAGDATDLLRAAAEAEARMDAADALRHYEELARLRPTDAFAQQKVARQYSDLVSDQPDEATQLRYARQALAHSERAVQLDPRNAVNVLSVAISRGKVALLSDVRTRVETARLVREGAEQALALDPDYAWAHHVLGRWHLEVASLAAAKRWLVRLLYGGLPPASVTEAVRELERAVALEPDELSHHVELGFAYAAAGRRAEARAAWERGLSLPDRAKPDQESRRRALAALARE